MDHNQSQIMSLVDTKPLQPWEETLALLCLIAERDDWTSLSDSLGSTFKSLAAGNQCAETLCYKYALNTERTRDIWSCFMSAEPEGKAYLEHLRDVMETAVVSALTTQQMHLSSPLCKLVAEYAQSLATHKLMSSTANFVEDTCYSMDYIGLPVQDDADTIASKVKIAIFDGSALSFYPINKLGFWNRSLVTRSIHDCTRRIQLSPHGVMCASIVAGKHRTADFFDTCEGVLRGVVPASKIYTYALGCTDCSMLEEHFERAFNQAIVDQVQVISMSIGRKNLNAFPSIRDDEIGFMTLKAFRYGILTCVSAGNKGPEKNTLNYGMPWCMNVGASTRGKLLTTKLTIGIKGSKRLREIEVKEIVSTRDGSFSVIDEIEGTSFNVFKDDKFYPFEMQQNTKDKESVVYHASEAGVVQLLSGAYSLTKHSQGIAMTDCPMALVRREDTNRFRNWLLRLGSGMYVRISTSKFTDDGRKTHVPHFSSRGPSLTYTELVMPDIVAPGDCIVGSWPSHFPLTKCEATHMQLLSATQNIKSGTSFSTPHVAGAAALVKHYHPEWSPSAVKSALMTTAQSLVECDAPGDEMAFGAGLMQPQKARSPGLIYDETFVNFARYRLGARSVYDLNLPSFAASFAASHQHGERVFPREVTYVGEKPVTYVAEITIFTKTLDPDVSITVDPTTLTFDTFGQKKQFTLTVRVRPRALGHVSAILKWLAPDCNEVNSVIHLYQDVKCVEKPLVIAPKK